MNMIKQLKRAVLLTLASALAAIIFTESAMAESMFKDVDRGNGKWERVEKQDKNWQGQSWNNKQSSPDSFRSATNSPGNLKRQNNYSNGNKQGRQNSNQYSKSENVSPAQSNKKYKYYDRKSGDAYRKHGKQDDRNLTTKHSTPYEKREKATGQSKTYSKSINYSDNKWPDNKRNNIQQYSKRTESSNWNNKKTPTVTRISTHRPDYKLYKRNKYVYYRSPWYSTYYLAPIHRHYHRTGYRVSYLPVNYVSIVVHNVPYYYYSGVYYRPYNSGYIVVSAPFGAFVKTLPLGFIAFSLGISTYYYVNDTYYIWDEPKQGYIVVEKPVGAETAIEEATNERLFAYPKAGQNEEQQARDRYECHRWGVEESGVDPTIEDEEYTTEQKSNYKRAMSACLEGRQYAVK